MKRRRSTQVSWWMLLTAIALCGCGSISPKPGDSSGSALGQRIATAATAAVTGSTTATRSNMPTTAVPRPESIHLPPPPSATAPRSQAILRVATRFARAYLLYQAGRDPHPVREAILATSTPSFGRLLTSQPVSIPASQRRSRGAQPSELGPLTYTGPAALGPGPPLQIVIARYHTLAHPPLGGRLTIELAGLGGQWLVSNLR